MSEEENDIHWGSITHAYQNFILAYIHKNTNVQTYKLTPHICMFAFMKLLLYATHASMQYKSISLFLLLSSLSLSHSFGSDFCHFNTHTHTYKHARTRNHDTKICNIFSFVYSLNSLAWRIVQLQMLFWYHIFHLVSIKPVNSFYHTKSKWVFLYNLYLPFICTEETKDNDKFSN